MAFTRKFLTDHGVPEDQVDAIMQERNRTLGDYVPKSDVQAQIDAAVQAALKDAPQAVDPTETDAYKAIAEERDMLRALGGDEFASVKPKFREAVYKMIDRSEGAPSMADQLKTVQEKYEEYFNPAEPAEPAKTPQFGAGVQGSMPTGKTTPSFGDYWGFGKTKGE